VGGSVDGGGFPDAGRPITKRPFRQPLIQLDVFERLDNVKSNLSKPCKKAYSGVGKRLGIPFSMSTFAHSLENGELDQRPNEEPRDSSADATTDASGTRTIHTWANFYGASSNSQRYILWHELTHKNFKIGDDESNAPGPGLDFNNQFAVRLRGRLRRRRNGHIYGLARRRVPGAMKMQIVIPIVLLSSLCGGVFGAVLENEIVFHRTQDIVRAHQIQIEDIHGAIKATLAAEPDGSVYLRFLAPDSQGGIRLGEQGQDEKANAGTGPAPILEFSTKDGQSALRISADREDNGLIAFSDRKRENTLLLGHFPLQTDFASGSAKHEWGLHIRREHGETGVGILDTPGLPVDYISPVPHGKP
jgi:hypothetical protein